MAYKCGDPTGRIYLQRTRSLPKGGEVLPDQRLEVLRRAQVLDGAGGDALELT